MQINSILNNIHLFLVNTAQNSPNKLALFSGILLGFSFPPFPFPFLALIAFLPTLYYINFNPNKRFFRFLLWQFLPWNIIGCYWLCLTVLGANSMSESMENFTAGFLAILLNPMLQSIPFIIYARINNKFSTNNWTFWSLIPLFVSFEFLHFNWDLTWSWMTLGHAFSNLPYYIQYIEWTGILGVSAFIILINLLLFKLLTQEFSKKSLYILYGILILPLISNFYFLSDYRNIYESSGKMYVRIIQPNIDPFQKFEIMPASDQIDRFCNLISEKGFENQDLILLPETAIPYSITSESIFTDQQLKKLSDLLKSKNKDWITGLVLLKYFEKNDKKPVGVRENDGYFYQFYNSSMIVNKNGIQIQEKAKLVPFVERVPFLENLAFLKDYNINLAGTFGNYGLPDSIHSLSTSKGIKIASIVCYESIFGGYVRNFINHGGELVSIITNDGWWSNSSGYRQHAAYARLRAIETRRSVVRSANTGYSLAYDSKGFLIGSTEWWKPCKLDVEVNLYQNKTLYVLLGDWFAMICLLISIFTIVFWKLKK